MEQKKIQPSNALPVALTKYAQHAEELAGLATPRKRRWMKKDLAKLVAIFKMREKIIVGIQFWWELISKEFWIVYYTRGNLTCNSQNVYEFTQEQITNWKNFVYLYKNNEEFF